MAEHLLADWSVRTADIPARGLDVERAATPSQCQAIAQALDLIALNALTADYKVRPDASGFRLTGKLRATCQQACIVTLDPVDAVVHETFDVRFVDGETAVPEAGGEGEVLSAEEIEPFANGVLDVGRIVFETLAAGLDPYPRKDGAEFTWTDPAAADPAASGPFAGLAKLRPKEQD